MLLIVILGLATGVWAERAVANQFFHNGYSQSMTASPADAIKAYDIAILLDSSHAAALLNRGSAKASLGQLDSALVDCSKAIEVGGSNEFLAGAHLIRSAVKRDSGNFDGALADLNKAIELDPTASNAFYERGLMRANLGDKTTAIADFTESIRLNPAHADAYTARGYELDHLDDASALADYNQALALDPNNVAALYGRSYARMRMGDKEGAISDLKELVKHKTPCAGDLRKLLNSLQARKQVTEQDLRRFSGHSCGTEVA